MMITDTNNTITKTKLLVFIKSEKIDIAYFKQNNYEDLKIDNIISQSSYP